MFLHFFASETQHFKNVLISFLLSAVWPRAYVLRVSFFVLMCCFFVGSASWLKIGLPSLLRPEIFLVLVLNSSALLITVMWSSCLKSDG